MSDITKISQLNAKEVTEKVYSKFFFDSYNNNKFDVDIVCNNKKNSKTKTSFRFSGDDGEMDILERVFGISKTKMDKVLDGVAVDSRILTLHSSALLVLLVFYKVNTDNPIVIEGIKYNKVMFEVKNKVVGGGRGPSRVDVLLVSEDEKKLLFLESKFKEPLTLGKKDRNRKYEGYYEKLTPYLIKAGNANNDSVLEYSVGLKKDKKGDDLITITGVNGSKRYCEGITQMIAHFIGLCKGPIKGNNRKYVELFTKAEKLILGEILFEFPKPDYKGMQTKIDDYKTLYGGLAKVLKKEKFLKVEDIENDDKEIVVLENALTYQRVLEENPVYKNKLDARVRDFYHF